jgi:RHS repeat-associated protein
MNPKPPHTEPYSNSKAAAYGYGAYTSTPTKAMYAKSSETDSHPIAIGFGARYYDSGLSVWLSVDPLAFKYPHESPYSYVGNRPINTIDPWGMDKVEDPNGNTGEAGDYKQTADKKYLYGDGLKTKVWDPNYDGGGNRAGGPDQKGGYVNYDGDAINFGSCGKDSPNKNMANIADQIRNTPFLIIPGLPMPVANPYYQAEAIVFGGTGTLVGEEYGKGGFFILAGKDKGAFHSFTEFAVGISSDIFLGISEGRVDYTGNSEHFTSQMLFGKRLKGWIGVGEGLSGGISFSRAKVFGGEVYSTEVNLGFGASVIPYVGVGINTGTIR